MDSKRIYRLYALPLEWKAVQEAMSQEYSRITPTPNPGYVLIYTDGKKPSGAQEITKDREELLSSADIRWLAETAVTILSTEAEKETPEMMEKLSERVEILGQELAKKKKELNEGSDPLARTK